MQPRLQNSTRQVLIDAYAVASVTVLAIYLLSLLIW